MISYDLLMMLCLFLFLLFLNPLHGSFSREANIHIFWTVNSIIHDIIRSNYDPTLTYPYSRQGALILWHEKEANPLGRYCAGGRQPAVPYNLLWKCKKTQELWACWENLIWTQVHFNIILPNVQSGTVHALVAKHIQTDIAIASPADKTIWIEIAN